MSLALPACFAVAATILALLALTWRQAELAAFLAVLAGLAIYSLFIIGGVV